MAKENAKKFWDSISVGGELQDKVKAAVTAYSGDKKDLEAVYGAVLAPIAKEAGLEFTCEELKEVAMGISGGDEISADDLKKVAGGKYIHFPW